MPLPSPSVAVRPARPAHGLRRAAAFLSALLAGCLILAGTVAAAPAAWAHARLVSSNPEDGSSVIDMPTHIEFVFNEEVNRQFSQVVLEDERGETHPANEVTVQGPRVTAVVPAEVTSSSVVARYRVVSADGHPIGGEISFAVENAPAAGGASPAATSAPPTAGDGATGEDRSDEGTTGEGTTGEGTTNGSTADEGGRNTDPAAGTAPSSQSQPPSSATTQGGEAASAGQTTTDSQAEGSPIAWLLGGMALVLLAVIVYGIVKRTRH